jgi:hypothetical protein
MSDARAPSTADAASNARAELTNCPESKAIPTIARAATSIALALLTQACVLHDDGLTVEVSMALEPGPLLADASLTRLELLACPGTTSATNHHHDALAPFALPLGGHERALLTPRAGRYCDLLLQVESPGIGARQAVLPLTCEEERVELTLDASGVGQLWMIQVAGAAAGDPGTEAHALEELLRASSASACP